MTIIVARKYKEKIIIAADSQATWGDSGKELNCGGKILMEEIKIK